MKAMLAIATVVVALAGAPAVLAGPGFTTENSASQNGLGHSQPVSSPGFITENSASQNGLDRTVPAVAPAGFRWADAGIGASATLGAVLVALGGTLIVLRRRDHAALAA